MHIPKNYFQDRLVLLLISVNAFFAVLTTLLILFRLRGGGSDGYIGQYHANLGILSGFEPGSAMTFFAFIALAVFVLVFHTMLSMRMYHRRRQFSITVLWLGLLLLILSLIVSNALLVLQ